ncbi:hypothetical protein [Nostoc sp. GT001]|uniref:hypothetical protein n=1 Tax=Nostoc sp. GT001 TaxID=3056647 RepID=UPI0025AA9975|nr:hypothetical protein [Nostoc sp. GT001]MDM9584057.1 hypothetical protein [Nostoc sp. GT001]
MNIGKFCIYNNPSYLIEGITTGAADLDEDGVVSIDELHEYASRKVREIQPTMKPEIYTSREGFKIRLTKVPQGDPKQKYRKEVARYSSRGDVSFVVARLWTRSEDAWEYPK